MVCLGGGGVFSTSLWSPWVCSYLTLVTMFVLYILTLFYYLSWLSQEIRLLIVFFISCRMHSVAARYYHVHTKYTENVPLL